MAGYCGFCGARLNDADRVCASCGTPVSTYDVTGRAPLRDNEITLTANEPPMVGAFADDEMLTRPAYDRIDPDGAAYELRYAARDVTVTPPGEFGRSRNMTIEDIPAPQRSRSKKPLIAILAGVLALLLGAAAVVFFVIRPFEDDLDRFLRGVIDDYYDSRYEELSGAFYQTSHSDHTKYDAARMRRSCAWISAALERQCGANARLSYEIEETRSVSEGVEFEAMKQTLVTADGCENVDDVREFVYLSLKLTASGSKGEAELPERFRCVLVHTDDRYYFAYILTNIG